MSSKPTIEEVRSFWDSTPLGVDFIPHPVASAEWFSEFDRLKTEFGLIGCLDDFAPPTLSGKRVLDVGCGPGYWARLLIPRGVDYWGIDISPRSVELAKRSLALRGLAGHQEVGNAERLRFEDSSFDAAISEGVVHHTPDTQACVDEIFRVLKPGGRAAVSVYFKVAPLRSPLAFRLTQIAMRLIGMTLGGRGRESMPTAATPESFVRMYDGASNPIGKAFTEAEVRALFERFSSVRVQRYFLPYSPVIRWMPPPLRRLLSRRGLMILAVAIK
jgi:ubiquinone/menaquinone biosynthesis C-methylase UbiE